MARTRTRRPTLPTPPRLLTVSIWSYFVVAAANVVAGAYSLSFLPSISASYGRQGRAVPEQAIVLTVVTVGLATVLFSGALIFLALRLRGGNTWARPALITVSILSLAALLTGGGPGLVVILLCLIAGVLVTRAPVTAWLRSARGLAPA